MSAPQKNRRLPEAKAGRGAPSGRAPQGGGGAAPPAPKLARAPI